MTPRQFETRYEPLWAELEQALAALDGGRKRRVAAPAAGARVATLYRQCCEHLALARERAYPVHLVARLETLAARAHQRIYRRHDYGLAALRDLVLHDVPCGVRALRWHLLVAALVTIVPAIAVGIATWLDPHFVLSVISVEQTREYQGMYGPETAEHLGRTSGDDWQMFGLYIMNNIGISFRCFASGILLGIGSLFLLAYNGALLGAVAGFLTIRGDGERLFSYVVTHAAFELTAIVLSGAAGLKLGHAMLAPGRRTRGQALRVAALEATPVMYGVFVMLIVAASIEAFWSSAGWIAPQVKYAVGAGCWVLVLSYLGLQGTPRAGGRPR